VPRKRPALKFVCQEVASCQFQRKQLRVISGVSKLLSFRQALIEFVAYFENIHPMYPFLNRKIFEEKALSPQIESMVETNIAWSALYHGVLALGSQFHDRGDFSPGKGLPWQLFKHALGMMPNLVGPDATLLNVQVWIPSLYRR
jgi:hypothetical protein